MASSEGVDDASGDEALMKRILATHEHLYVKKFDPNPLLHAIKDVIQRASEGSPSVEGYASAFKGDLLDNLKHLPYKEIKSVSCEFSCKCSGASMTSDQVAIGILQSLGSYSWEAKAVITLAAFAAIYGSYFSVSQFQGSNDPFSKSMAFLQLSPSLLKQAPLKLKPEALKVVEAILDLANYIVEISQMFATREEDLAKAVYLSIQSTVACASILMNTVALGNEYEPTVEEAQELSNLKMEINKMESWKKQIEEESENHEKLDSLFKQKHTDNIKILQALLCSTLIYNCSTKTQEELNKLSGKYVLLYFSYLEHLSEEEIYILSKKYEIKLTSYEIVWVPIVDVSTSWNKKEIEKYEKMRDSMRWYTINEPWKLNKAVIKYIKKWKFEGESEFVVLSPQGEFVISGAINLISFLEKFDFKINYNDNRWKGKMIQLLQDTMGSIVNDWISTGKYVFLFGGDDTKWIQNFVNGAQRVAEDAKDVEDAKIGFVMMYAGKSNLNWVTYQDIYKQLQETSNTISVSGFGDQKNMSSFWATLRSIWLTEIKTGKMDDMATLWTFDASGGGWAAICHGKSPEMAKARGETIPDILRKYSEWEALAKRDGFLNALVQKIQEDKTPKDHHDCYNLQVAATTESTPKKMKCSLCDSAMKTFITYRCCGDR